MSTFCYELFFAKPQLAPSDWEVVLNFLEWYIGRHGVWKILVRLEAETIHYYLEVPLKLPPKTNFSSVAFQPTAEIPKITNTTLKFSPTLHLRSSLQKIIERIARFGAEFVALELKFPVANFSEANQATVYYKRQQQIYRSSFVFVRSAQLLSFDFSNPHGYLYKKISQTLRFDKVIPIFTSSSEHAILKFSGSLQSENFLEISNFDFAKHSLTLGESGSGKSKFVAHLIEEIYNTSREDYRVVVFDPHDSMKHDLTNIADQKVFSFNSASSSINLFINDPASQTSSVELFLSLMQSLMRENYNSRLERVLRFGYYLLSAADELSLPNFRDLLLNPEYCNQLCNQYRQQLPQNVIQFFLTEFSVIKSQFYDQAIAPIISFLDEIQMLPAFNIARPVHNFADLLNQNFLTTLSFNSAKLGLKSTQIITGFLLQQIFQLATSYTFSRHLIVVIDEISVLETPFLRDFYPSFVSTMFL